MWSFSCFASWRSLMNRKMLDVDDVGTNDVISAYTPPYIVALQLETCTFTPQPDKPMVFQCQFACNRNPVSDKIAIWGGGSFCKKKHRRTNRRKNWNNNVRCLQGNQHGTIALSVTAICQVFKKIRQIRTPWSTFVTNQRHCCKTKWEMRVPVNCILQKLSHATGRDTLLADNRMLCNDKLSGIHNLYAFLQNI